MGAFIALLRGINVGGHNKVSMSALRDLFGALGLAGAATALQSGNVVFKGDGRGAGALEALLERETEKRLGVSAEYVVRSAAEWGRVIARNPFEKAAEKDPSHLLVMFFKTAPAEKNVEALRGAIKGPEVVERDGKHLYIAYPAGIGRSKLTGAVIERALRARGTARNWNTVLKVGEMCG